MQKYSSGKIQKLKEMREKLKVRETRKKDGERGRGEKKR